MQLTPNIHFNKGEVIFKEGHPADSVYLICSGRMEVLKQDSSKSDVTLAYLGENDIFGEMAIISDAPRHASVIASEDSWCYFMRKDSFMQRLKETDERVLQVFEHLIEAIKDKGIKDMAIKNAKDKSTDELDELLSESGNYGSLESSDHAKYKILSDKDLIRRVKSMDIFMRMLFKSLMRIAYD